MDTIDNSKPRSTREHRIVVFRHYDYVQTDDDRSEHLNDLNLMRKKLERLPYKKIYIYFFAENYTMYRWKYYKYSKDEQLLFLENSLKYIPLERWQFICYEHGLKCPLEYVSAKSRGRILQKSQGLAIIRRNGEPMQCILHECAAQLMDDFQHNIEETYQFAFYKRLVH